MKSRCTTLQIFVMSQKLTLLKHYPQITPQIEISEALLNINPEIVKSAAENSQLNTSRCNHNFFYKTIYTRN